MTPHQTRPILFSGAMVRAILDGRNGPRKKVYSISLPETDPQHLANRIMNSIGMIDDGGCWVWSRATSAGYGSMTICGRSQRAHVVAWSISRRQTVPKGMCVCHSCDNPLCVNPDHLFLGTRSDNMNDMVSKGRHGGPPPSLSGEDNPASRLTSEKVDQIRLALRRGEVQQRIADRFGVSQSTISKINMGLSW
jgi:hypothetical protein